MNQENTCRPSWLVVPAAALLSYAVLVFEVALTRIFSLLLSYHFVFVIVSGAAAGLGIGAMARAQRFPQRCVKLSAILFALLAAASVVIVVRLPPIGKGTLPVFVVLTILPFIAAGFAVAGILQENPRRISMLYGADLIGAACGALSVVPLLDALGAIDTVLLAATIGAVGALCLESVRVRLPLASGGVFVGLAGLFVVVLRLGLEVRLPITDDPDKEMFFLLSDPALKARIIETRWSSFGRTDVVQSESASDRLMLFVDGAAGSLMYDAKALLGSPRKLAYVTAQYGGFFPLPLLKQDEKHHALIVGSGGGKDVVAALLGGVEEITAVEVNPDVVGIVRDYEKFNGGIYSERHGVTAVVAEGRSFLRSTSSLYDLILLAIPVTKSSRSVDGYTLTENYLFTVEAFADYLDHLTPNGRIILVAHNEMEIYRLISLAEGAFERQGIGEQEMMKRIYTIPAPLLPALVVQKRPLTSEDAVAVDDRLRRVKFDKRPSYVPYRNSDPALRDAYVSSGSMLPVVDERLTSVAEGRTTLATLARSATYDITAVTDDRPFFYRLDRGLPSVFGIFSVIIAAVGGLALLVGSRKPSKGNPQPFTGTLRCEPVLKRLVAIFFLLGAGYMMIEIALFQKLMLFVGQPQKALTVLLFCLLLGGGLGSLVSSSLKGPIAKTAAWIALATGITVFLLSFLFAKLFALGLAPQVVSAAHLMPLGFMMGFPFPIALRLAGAYGLERHVSVLWGINGIASALGSALCMIVAFWFGFSWALLLGASSYVLVAVLFFGLPAPRRPPGMSNKNAGSDAASPETAPLRA